MKKVMSFFLISLLISSLLPPSAFSQNMFQKGQHSSVDQSYISDVIPVFNMLAFYDTDFEIANSYEEADFFGRIHCNGSVFIDARRASNDAMRFHNVEGVPTITCTEWIYRRAKTGQCSEYTESSYDANGLRFFYYDETTWANIIDSHSIYNGGGTDGGHSFVVPLIQEHTNSSGSESKKRHGDGLWNPNDANIYNGYGYVFISDLNGSNDYLKTFGGDDYYIAQSDQLPIMTVPELVPPVTINPYSFIEDIQYADTADTIDYSDTPSNFSEDTNSKLKLLSFAARAPLVIRDGVAYYRSTPGGALTRVTGKVYTDGKTYYDLRWYGHFGASADADDGNPDRWHFPIKSVTILDYDVDTPDRLVFTDNLNNSFDPSNGNPSYIDKTRDLDVVYTKSGTLPKTDDYIRTWYNELKSTVRTMYNASHLYMSNQTSLIYDSDGDGTADAVCPMWDDDNNGGTPPVELFPLTLKKKPIQGNPANSGGNYIPGGVTAFDPTESSPYFPSGYDNGDGVLTDVDGRVTVFRRSTLPLSDKTIETQIQADINVFNGDPSTYLSSNPSEALTGLYKLLNNPEFANMNGIYTGNYTVNGDPVSGGSNRNRWAPPFQSEFRYYMGENGGYFGNDNLCMYNERERKFVVFTEIDMSEFTQECIDAYGLDNFFGDDNDSVSMITAAKDSTQFENIVYVVNSSMGENIFGKRVHCGAVRIKRGSTIPWRMAVATPNPLYIWGDFNCPDFEHRAGNHNGARPNNRPVTDSKQFIRYFVPTTFYGENRTWKPAAFYADSLNWLGNNTCDPTRLCNNKFYNQGTTVKAAAPYYFFEHQGYWEDDGVRTFGDGDNKTYYDYTGWAGTHADSPTPCQSYFNYTKGLDFDFSPGPAGCTGNRRNWWAIEQFSSICIKAGLFYGNVPSRQPVYFHPDDITAYVTTPGVVTGNYASLLDCYLDNIPNDEWVEMTRAQLIDFSDGNITLPAEYGSVNLTFGNYYGKTISTTYERSKYFFHGGGFLDEVRNHAQAYHHIQSFNDIGFYVIGSMACLFRSRQDTHLWNVSYHGHETPMRYFAFDSQFLDSDELPPGTPLTTRTSGEAWSVGSRHR